MEAIVVAAVCLLWTCNVTSTVTVDRTRLLSTEKARATVTIVNGSAQPVFFDLYGASFLFLDGSNRVEPVLRSFRMPVAQRIDPGSTYARKLDLPSCFVHSDPCTQNILLRYAISQGRQPFWIEKRLPQYVFVPDPTATYAIDGLTGNRAVFITPGIARETVTPDTLEVDLTASGSEPQPPFKTSPPLVADVAQALKAQGVAPDSTGYSTSNSTWSVQLRFLDGNVRFNDIVRALDRIRTAFQARISGISRRFVFDQNSGDEALAARANDDAFKAGQRLALMIHAGDITPITGNNGSSVGSFPQLYSGYDAGPDSTPDFTHGMPLFRGRLDMGTWPQPTPVAVVVESIYPSTRPARFSVDPGLVRNAAPAFRQPDSWSLPAFNPQLAMVSDRPELYVIGTASKKAALASRIVPEFVAALDARERTRRLANVLRVREGIPSLFALYPAAESSDLVNLGVTTTFTGTGLRESAPSSPDPQVLAFRSDDSQQRPMLPISVPDEETILREVAGATVIAAPDALRLDVQLRYDAPAGLAIAATDPAAVSKALRQLRFVMDVAATTQPFNRPGAAYEIIVRGADRKNLVRVLDVLQSMYGSLHPDITTRISGLAFNCDGLERRMAVAGIRQAAAQAKSDAAAGHRRLRKLLLAAVYPIDSMDACTLRAKASDDLQYSPPNALGDVPRKPRLFVDTLLVYRTW